MDDLLDKLNKSAQQLLEGAKELDAEIGGADQDIEAAKNRLRKLCKVLSRVISQLKKRGSLLHRLDCMIDGTSVNRSLDRLSDYLRDHRATLIRLQVPKALIERVVTILSNEASSGNNALDKPQTLTVEAALEPLQQLRDVVCEIANAAEFASIVSTPGILKQVAAGCIGAAVIVLDITAAIAAAPTDPIGWVLLKAVKSVWGGGSMVRGAVSELRGILNTIRNAQQRATTEEIQRRLGQGPRLPSLKIRKGKL